MAGLAWRDGASGFLEVDGNRIEYGMWGPGPGTGKAGSPGALAGMSGSFVLKPVHHGGPAFAEFP